MPFITTPERVGRRAGMRVGIKTMLQFRFGEEGLKLMPDVEEVHEEERLLTILNVLNSPASIDEVRRLCTPSSTT
jgi:hypothetical protein